MKDIIRRIAFTNIFFLEIVKLVLFCIENRSWGSFKSNSGSQIIVLLGVILECTRGQDLAVHTKSVFVRTASFLTPGAL